MRTLRRLYALEVIIVIGRMNAEAVWYVVSKRGIFGKKPQTVWSTRHKAMEDAVSLEQTNGGVYVVDKVLMPEALPETKSWEV